MPEPFDALACDLARFQAQHVPGYAGLCRARKVDVAGLHVASQAPAVPTEAFKLARVAALPEAEMPVVFHTSGTTSGARGAHSMRDTRTYDAAALAFGRWALTSDLKGRPRVLVLAPSPEEAPDSSLSHMLGLFARELGEPVPGRDASRRAQTFFVRDGILDVAALDACVAQALLSDHPVLLLATSFALVHLLDALGEARFSLPAGSRAMQTGGFKARSREVEPSVLRRDLARAFDVDEASIVAEYGMTELSSQFYETTLRSRGARHGVYVEPPWARVVPVDPESLQPVAEGDEGIARVEDLMNVDGAFAVLAADRVRRVPGGFELLGRAPGAPPRGCSIAVDEILGTPTGLGTS